MENYIRNTKIPHGDLLIEKSPFSGSELKYLLSFFYRQTDIKVYT